MSLQSRFLFYIAASAILVQCGPVQGQTSGDFRLTEDQFDRSLPADIQIQDVGEIDSAHRLVVWGTTGFNNKGDVANRLVGYTNEKYITLTSKEAVPYGVVSIISLKDRFLVVWNDRRSGSKGLYGRFVLIDGSMEEDFLIQAEERIGQVVGRWRVRHKIFFLWNSAGIGGAWMMEIDKETNVIQKPVKIAVPAINLGETYSIGQTLFLHLSNRQVATLSPLGEINMQVVPPGRLDLPHYFTGDSSLAVLDGTLLHFYNSFSAELPENTVDLSPIIEGKNILALNRDSAGWFVAYTQWTGDGGGQYNAVNARLVMVRLYFDPDNILDTVTTGKGIAYLSFPPSGNGWQYTRVDAIKYREPNVVQVQITVYGGYDLTGSPPYNYEPQTSVTTISGKIIGEPLIFDPYPYIQRVSSYIESSVVVTGESPDDRLKLVNEIVPKPLNVSYNLRSIGAADGQVCIRWDHYRAEETCQCYNTSFTDTVECSGDLDWKMADSIDSWKIITSRNFSIVLRGGLQGIRATVFDRYSNIVRSESGITLNNIRLTETNGRVNSPIGCLRNDTLFFAWEDDALAGRSDIYAAWWKLPKYFLTEEGEIILTDTTTPPPNLDYAYDGFFQGVHTHGITPNPALGSASIALETRYYVGYATISIFDIRGREVRSFAVDTRQGKYAYFLDLSDLPGGTYGVRVSTEKSLEWERLVILPD